MLRLALLALGNIRYFYHLYFLSTGFSVYVLYFVQLLYSLLLESIWLSDSSAPGKQFVQQGSLSQRKVYLQYPPRASDKSIDPSHRQHKDSGNDSRVVSLKSIARDSYLDIRRREYTEICAGNIRVLRALF